GGPWEEIDPVSVFWIFAGMGEYAASYQPTVQAAIPNYDVNFTANPVNLYYWWPGSSQIPMSPVEITCMVMTPYGSIEDSLTLMLTSNVYNLAASQMGDIQLIVSEDGDTRLSFGGDAAPGFAAAYQAENTMYPGWLGSIQLVNSVRKFTGASG